MATVSIVIPTYNRLEQLKKVIKALEVQTVSFELFEVIVVSDGSSDGTHDFLACLQTPLRFKFIRQTNNGPAAARNVGVRNASGKIVLFIDDDVVPTHELLAQHIRTHEKSRDDIVVLGPMLTPEDFRMSPWVRWEQSKLLDQYQAMMEGQWAPTARQFYTGNSSLSRSQIIAAGGFDEKLRRAEDVDLGYRIAERGLQFKFNPKAIGYHYADRSFQSWIASPYQYGRNDVIISLDKGQNWLIDVAADEFCRRRIYTRCMVATCLRHRLFAQTAVNIMRLTAELGNSFKLESLTQASYSGIFNLRYYQGIKDELGDRQCRIGTFFQDFFGA